MNNPYPTRSGFGLRVINTKRALMQLGRDPFANIYTSGFDNCFEMGDGNAVVFALIKETKAGNEALFQGIEAMGANVWKQWQAVYFEGLKMLDQPSFLLRNDQENQS